MNFKTISLFILLLGFINRCTDRVPEIKTPASPLPACNSELNCVSRAWQFPGTVSETHAVALEVLNGLGAERVRKSANAFECEFTIPVFGWKDDVHIQLEANADGTVVYIRSASRVGTWDIFANRLRVLRIVRKMSYKV